MDKETLLLLEGDDYWRLAGEHSLSMSDGPHGLRREQEASKAYGKSHQATCFPTLGALACSWNHELLYRVGEALAEECLHQQVDILLGPGVNIKRDPRGGRNFEYFSEDPLLAGELAVAYIEGLQSRGIGASLKHYALNNQESFRMINESVVDERALREIYLKPFEIAVKEAKPWTVMSSYNRFEGVNAGENQRLMKILRDEWGFEGLVVSDWASVNDRVLGIQAGMDIEMPGGSTDSVSVLSRALKEGKLQASDIERSLQRLDELKHKSRTFPRGEGESRHPNLALQAALESLVLLQNDGTLPLKEGERVALCGSQSEHFFLQGLGSSRVNPWEEPDLRSVLEEYVDLVSIEEAERVLLLVGGEADSEGYDRRHLSLLPKDLRLMEELLEKKKQIILVVVAGGPMEIPSRERFATILLVPLAGEASAHALAQILLGRTCPSGKLAESWPLKLEDVPSYPYYLSKRTLSYYKESFWVGYRYYSSFEKKVAWPFGHGLSYSEFRLGELKLGEKDDELIFHCSLKNEGDFTASQVVQLYLSKTDGILRPKLELKAFHKIPLQAGEEKSFTLTLKKEQLKIYLQQAWRLEAGQYDFYLGFSSEELCRKVSVSLEGEELVDAYPAIYKSMNRPIRLLEFAHLFEEKSMPMKASKRDGKALTVAEIGGFLGETLDRLLLSQGQGIEGDAEKVMEMLRSMPLQALSKLSRGSLSPRRLKVLLSVIRWMEAEEEFYE